MRIAVMGSGGVGGYYGARLAEGGAEVAFIARGAHLEAIRDRGLRVESQLGDVLVEPARATDDPAEIGPVDIVLFATKLWDVESAGEACRPLLGPDTAVITFLNGVDSGDRLAGFLGPDHVAGGVAWISAEIGAPGLIRHHSAFARIAYGELDGKSSPRLGAFHQAVLTAGIDGAVSDDIRSVIWGKFAMLAPMAGVTTLTRQPLGPIREDPDMRRLLRDAVEEVVAVAAAMGIDIADQREKTMHLVDEFPYEGKSSMLMDLEKGGRLELEWLSGAVLRLGREFGVETSTHRVIHAALKPWAEGPLAADKGGPAA